MDILLKPIITEKLTEQEDAFNRYGFIVAKSANKLQIKKAVEDMYSVSVASVNTMNYLGKAKSRYTKAGVVSGRKNSYKKAIITLVEGEKIDFFSNI